MNRQFYEFWASFFTNAAQGQKQFEDVSALFKQGASGWNEMTQLFMRSYGLKPPQSAAGTHSPEWQSAIADFQQTFAQFAAQWGWVSQTEHQQVLEKCTSLEKKVEEQQATISQLRSLMAKEGLGYAELVEHLKGSFKDQSEQFKAIMDSISQLGNDKANGKKT